MDELTIKLLKAALAMDFTAEQWKSYVTLIVNEGFVRRGEPVPVLDPPPPRENIMPTPVRRQRTKEQIEADCNALYREVGKQPGISTPKLMTALGMGKHRVRVTYEMLEAAGRIERVAGHEKPIRWTITKLEEKPEPTGPADFLKDRAKKAREESMFDTWQTGSGS